MTRILLVGGGGREHALAWRLGRDDPALELIAAPGNPGIAAHGRCVPVAATDIKALVTLARSERVDAVFVGPEGPLALGLVDRLGAEGVAAFGPTAAAAMLETSKRFAKDVMRDAGVPTARASVHADAAGAKRAAAALGAPVVIKASGLAAGKGVVVCDTLTDAEHTIDDMLGAHSLGDAGNEVLVEEFMTGEELSLFVLTDGTGGIALVPAQDHKRLLAGDTGPNTGGMGAYAPVSISTPREVQRAMQAIVMPTLEAMRDRGTPFRGLLYAGLMLTPDGPKVVEFNCRFGDPETQPILMRLESDLLEALEASIEGRVSEGDFRWSRDASVCVVMSSGGYPGTYELGKKIMGLEDAGKIEGVKVFHAGTTRRDGAFFTAGGRVLGVTSRAPDLETAVDRVYAAASKIGFEGAHYRKDIASRAVKK